MRQAVPFTSDVERMITVLALGPGPICISIVVPCIIQRLQAPASTAGLKRNHKTDKQFLNPTRCRLNDDRVKKQVSMAQNLTYL